MANPNWISEKKGEETRAAIVDLIRRITDEGGTVHRALIAKELDVTRTTAGKHIDRLIEDKVLREVDGRYLEIAPKPKRKAAAK